MNLSENTRTVIDGDPGAGKTTFIKRLCYVWAKTVLQEDIQDSGSKHIKKYTLVLPVILRLLTKEESFLDILSSQLNCLSICEICKILKLAETHPNQILLLQDGYDEYTGRSVISKILSKEEYSDVLCITTSRPHAIEQLKRQTTHAVENHIRLCGFSKDQVKQYIKQFCDYHNKPPETGEELIRVLFDERSDILEVAKIPIRTEMICIVWMVYGRLGKTLADLYKMFIIHLITHWYNKKEEISKISKDEVFKANVALLSKVGKLCNRWENNRLQIVFSTKEVQDVLDEDFNKVIQIGLIVKSHPCNILEDSKWSFPHLTIQEYFVAFQLGNDIENKKDHEMYIKKFTTRCKNYRVLNRCEVIFTFLCSKYPQVANKILTQIILEERDEKNCSELLKFVYKIIPHFENTTNINIPLPCYLHLPSDNHKLLDKLITSDERQKKPNLKHLILEKSGEYDRFTEVTYIEELKVTVNNEEDEKCVKQKVNKLNKLTSININSSLILTTCDAGIMKNINTDRLTDLSVTAPGALQAVADSIQRFTALQQLHVEDTSRDSNKLQAQRILSSLRNNNHIQQVSLCVRGLDDRIIKEKLNMKIKLKVKKDTLSEGSLREAVRDLDFTGCLYKLDLSRNNVRDEGESLGKLMARMTALRVLCVCDCTIEADTVQAMVKVVRDLQLTSNLHTLNMGVYERLNNNNLSSGGTYLGELISLTPDLHTLDLDDCNLRQSDLDDMSDNLQQTNKIQTLNLYHNNLGDGTGGGSRLIQNMPHLQAIRGGGYNPIPAFCRSVEAGSLNNLHILDMSDSELEDGSLHLLGQHLPNMNKLQVISLRCIYNVKPEDYHHVYGKVPESLQHLNIWSDDVKLDGYLLVEYKQQLRHLHRLNVNIPDTDLDMVQELLEQHNPDLHVYNDRNEDIW